MVEKKLESDSLIPINDGNLSSRNPYLTTENQTRNADAEKMTLASEKNKDLLKVNNF